MEFNSQICTTKEQSERLLSLGLKKETADMSHTVVVVNHKVEYKVDCSTAKSIDIPAWSLHRLIELMLCEPWYKVTFVLGDNPYELMVRAMEWNKGYLNKEYLVDQQTIEEHCKGVMEYLDYIREEN